MGAVQREAMWERKPRRDAALALSRCAIFWALALTAGVASGEGRARPAAKNVAPSNRKTSESVRLPGLTRGDTGRVADPRTLHGDSRIEEASATEPAGEHVVRPIPPASGSAQFGDTTQPPPFMDTTRPLPATNPASPFPATWPAPSTPRTGTPEPAHGTARPVPISTDAGTSLGLDEAPRALGGPERDAGAGVGDARPTAIKEKAWFASERSQPDPALAETSRRTGQPKIRAGKSRPGKPEQPSEDPPPSKPEDHAMAPGAATLDQIRLEIKSRLSYFQVCAAAARRRSNQDIRRLQATWFINADGTIRELKIEGVSDAQLAVCLSRAGSRPFPFPAGMALTIPTPIVFVR
jgi:hypothetical protein